MEKFIKGIMGNSKTTVLGVAAALAIVSTQVVALLDADPETIFNWESFWTGGIMAAIGLFAKDGDKTCKELKLEE